MGRSGGFSGGPGRRCFAAAGHALLIAATVGLLPGSAGAQEDNPSVVLGADETIRQIAEKYLNDPDLWPEILRASGIESIADLAPGVELTIPVGEIRAADDALGQSLEQIQKANQAGAQIFAPDEIGAAVDLHEQALRERLARAWMATEDLAIAAYEGALVALQVSEQERNQRAEALLSDRSGNVEGQRPEDLSWRDLRLRAILIEEEKVRTLSGSTAQITFRDASRLRLNANSNAVITEMRFDPLSRDQEAKVSLVEGDFYALLGSTNQRRKFDVKIPQVDTVINSGNFWVSNDRDQAKFANYDDEIVAVSARGSEVALGKNEGTIVDRGFAPREKIAVLPAPTPLEPANEGVVYINTPRLAWAPVERSAGYWVEIAGDQNFDRIVANGFGIGEPEYTAEPLEVGDYFWRVAALDGFGLPGVRSEGQRFSVAPDNTPPYLTIDKPVADTILREASIEVGGESEPGAVVTVNGTAVAIDADGRFATTVTADVGNNAVTVAAVDPAGNRTEVVRAFAYMPDTQSVVAFDPSLRQIAPRHFLANGDVISLSGTTTENAEIEVRAGDQVRASAVADEKGGFRINVPLGEDDETFDFAVIAPSGFTSTEEIAVRVDREAPGIAFDAFPPHLTAEPVLRIAGRTEADATLTLNGDAVVLDGGRFDQTVTLAPGQNVIELIATDPAGNVQIDKSVVSLDQDPPRLVTATGTPSTGGGQPVLMVEVVAEDASGLAKAAPFVVTVGSQSYPGFLRYNKAAQRYQASLVVPDGDLEAARISQVELVDDAGNSQIFKIEEKIEE